ncbi:hypothetical protein TMP139_160001 [Tenacibaculum maritimum]|nr:hypothetical protein TMP139_160001 [Tenacibaculum maritimum]
MGSRVRVPSRPQKASQYWEAFFICIIFTFNYQPYSFINDPRSRTSLWLPF